MPQHQGPKDSLTEHFEVLSANSNRFFDSVKAVLEKIVADVDVLRSAYDELKSQVDTSEGCGASQRSHRVLESSGRENKRRRDSNNREYIPDEDNRHTQRDVTQDLNVPPTVPITETRNQAKRVQDKPPGSSTPKTNSRKKRRVSTYSEPVLVGYKNAAECARKVEEIRAHREARNCPQPLLHHGCLHKGKPVRPATPEGYWALDFSETSTESP